MWRQRRRWRRRRGGRGEVDAWCWRSRRRGGRGEVDAASEDGIGDRDGEVPVERSEEALRQQRGHWQPWWRGRGVVGPGGYDKLLAGRCSNYPRKVVLRGCSGTSGGVIYSQGSSDSAGCAPGRQWSRRCLMQRWCSISRGGGRIK
ncbi:Os11g0261100 [Oryza sativa Japonica Group]|uniref:Os11g0261100 protein n=2 Tax=Oryza sativa subsp. japonica TaxID=39947 RepID=Q53L05_ORYSJ|nr:hypothetical protein LOC_Os11g15470 [Oryza sativa Japonica Group]ABA92550.1 hypothetical protein LOC_Os11g15470 [Oryza sativa Japonica Group]BAT13500.1 Os11g0261100 [Oryza sativa Japonica Group]